MIQENFYCFNLTLNISYIYKFHKTLHLWKQNSFQLIVSMKVSSVCHSMLKSLLFFKRCCLEDVQIFLYDLYILFPLNIPKDRNQENIEVRQSVISKGTSYSSHWNTKYVASCTIILKVTLCQLNFTKFIHKFYEDTFIPQY